MPNPCPLTALDPAQLTRARLRLAWELLSEAAAHLDLVPLPAREYVADALGALALAKAVVEEGASAVTARSPS